MLVGGETSDVVCPNKELEVSETGNAKFGWLNRLKNWNPIPSLPRSQWGIEVFLKIVKSVLTYCGPRYLLRVPFIPSAVSQPGIGKSPDVATVHGGFGGLGAAVLAV